MKNFVPMATAEFQPQAFYTPRPVFVNVQPLAGITDFGAASKGKKKKKKKSWWDQVKDTVQAAVPGLKDAAIEAGSDYVEKKTGVDLTPDKKQPIKNEETPPEATGPNWALIGTASVAVLAIGLTAAAVIRNSKS